MKNLTNQCLIRLIWWMIIGLVLTTILLNLLLLADEQLITYFKWVNIFTGFTLIAALILTWLARKLLSKQKTAYVHKVFSKN